MNRDEKIRKARDMIADFNAYSFQRPYLKLAEEIIDAIEEEPEQFFADEVVNETCHITMCLHRYGDLDEDEQQRCELEKLPTQVLAATIGARLEGVTWWSIDAEGCMTWWEKEPAYFEENYSLKPVAGWTNGGLIERLKTNIRQEPEKGRL